MWYAVAYAASQWIVKPLMAAFAPRSSCSHCGSLNADDQRVDWSPSTAAEAGVLEVSTDDAVASEPSAILASAACAVRCGAKARTPATTASTRSAPKPGRLRGKADGERRWPDGSKGRLGESGL